MVKADYQDRLSTDGTNPEGALSFGEQLRLLRVAAGLTQEELAERAGISAHSISNLERGVPHIPRPDTVHRLFDALELTTADRTALEAVFRAAARHRRARLRGQHEPSSADAASSSNDWFPADLPMAPTRLLGRDDARRALRSLLAQPEVRLISLTGAPGVGKTCLALQVARENADRYADGIVLVPLAPLRDPTLVTSAIAQALGLRETGSRSLRSTVYAFLRHRCLLLVLDNFEHLLGAVTDIADLLAACARLTMLVTSRACLRLRGEHDWPVQPLALPIPGREHDVEALRQSPAVALFVERAQSHQPDFVIDEINLGAVAGLCARLDGLPLAIELAAPLIRLLPPAMLLERATHRLPMLIGGARDLPERQQTLRRAIDWSYDLLDGEKQGLFRRLAVFSDGATLEAIEAVCAEGKGADDQDVVFEGVRGLIEQSLLQRETEAEGTYRYSMLETIREYATEKLTAHGELDETRRCHAWYFLALAEKADAKLRGPEQKEWQARLEAEHNNLRAALAWSLEAGETELGLRVAGALGWFWRRRGYLAEGLRWLERGLAEGAAVPEVIRAKALNAAGYLAFDRWDIAQAEACQEESLGLYRRLGDVRGITAALFGAGSVAIARENYAAAEAHRREVLTLAQEAGDTWEVAAALNSLAVLQARRGEITPATTLAEQALALFHQASDRQGIARTLMTLGDIAHQADDLGKARTHLEEGLALARDMGDTVGVLYALSDLAVVLCRQGKYHPALTNCLEALAIAQEVGSAERMAYCVEVAARAVARQDQLIRAARLLGLAGAVRDRNGISGRGAEGWFDAAEQERTVAALRQQLGEDTFSVAWEAGRAMPGERTVEEVFAVLTDFQAEASVNGESQTLNPVTG